MNPKDSFRANKDSEKGEAAELPSSTEARDLPFDESSLVRLELDLRRPGLCKNREMLVFED